MSVEVNTSKGWYWFNQSAQKEDMGIVLNKRIATLTLTTTLYKNIALHYSTSYIQLSGVSTFYAIINNKLISARTVEQKNRGVGDSSAGLEINFKNFDLMVTLLIPTGDSDYYPGKYPLGIGRWGIKGGIDTEFVFLIKQNFSINILYLFAKTFTYIDYLGNILLHKANGKGKLFFDYYLELPLYFSTLSLGFHYYHAIAISKENLLKILSKLTLPTGPKNEISISYSAPFYGRYYPSHMEPFFFWDKEFPLGYEIYVKWSHRW